SDRLRPGAGHPVRRQRGRRRARGRVRPDGVAARPGHRPGVAGGRDAPTQAGARGPLRRRRRLLWLGAANAWIYEPAKAGMGSGRGAVGVGNGLARTRCGHQNQRPISAAIDGVMKERTTSVSNSRPRPMVLPTWARITKALRLNESMVNAKTSPAEVT